MKTRKNIPEFLSGGGEMGELMRSFDWSKTPVGPIDNWPQSLKTTLSLLLNSKFPMFLWWGPDLICFYNDAYRPSLGQNGKHPSILGTPAKEAWPEIWPVISPLVESVLATGEATWFEDQLVPIYRNGHIEDVYWTFSYSPVTDDSGKRAGVFVTCTETTGKVALLKGLEESNKRFLNTILQAPVAMCILTGPQFMVELANEKMFELWGRTPAEMMNKPLFEGVYEAKNHGFEELIESVYKTGQTLSRQSVATTFLRKGNLEPGYVDVIYHPYRNTDGTITGVLAVATDTTPQVIARKKIEEAEENLRNTILQAPVAMCILIGPEFIVELANTKMFELWGKTSGETVGKPLFEGVYEAKDQGFEDWIGSVYKTGETVSVEGAPALLNRNGKVEQAYVNVIYQAYRNAIGAIIGVLAIAVDITAQVIARKKIEEAEEKARLAIRSADLGVYEIIYNTNEMYTDERFREIWGVDNTTERKKYTDLIHPDDWPQRIKAHEESLKTGHLEYRSRVKWKDQSFRWVKINGKVIFDDKGKPVKLLGIIQDITKESRQQQELEENGEKLNIVIDASELGIWEMNLKTEEVIYSDRYLEIFGYEKGALINHQQIFQHIHPEDIEHRTKSIEEAIISGTLHHKMRLITKDKSIRWIETQGKVFYDYNNKPDKMMGTIRDITREKQREHQLLESEVILDKLVKERTYQLERSNEDLQQFAHVASHDLKEPLRKIKMYTSRVEDEYATALPPKALEYLTQVTGASTRMQMMIDGILSFSSVNSSTGYIEKVNLNGVLNDVKNDLDIPIEQKKAILIMDELPEIQGAGILLYQLFYNLVSNSLKFSKPDTVPVIKVSASIMKKEGKEYAKILVADNGIGFNKEHAEQIFTTFVRLNSKDKYEGTGLGLSLCKKIAERHGGTIGAIGIENEGAVFTIMLPLMQSISTI
jgi:PAS domain S-box-containing protein